MPIARLSCLAALALAAAVAPASAQRAIFTAETPAGARVFLTDGTAGGTRALASLGDRDDNTITFAQAVGTRTVFANMRNVVHAVSPTGKIEEITDYGAVLGAAGGKIYLATLSGLLSTDGTAAGTRLVFAYSGNTVKLASFGGKTWLGYNGAGGLVFTNVAAPADSFTLPGVSLESPLLSIGTKAVFVGNTAATGAEPWVTDGTKAGTRILRDIAPGAGWGFNSLYPATVLGNRVLFVANTGVGANRVWATDGTPAGTKPIVNGLKVPASTFGIPLAGRLHYLVEAAGSPTGYAFKTANGTAVGDLALTVGGRRVFPINKYQKGELGVVGGKLVFEGQSEGMLSPVADTALYAYDPATRKTSLIANINKTNDDGRARDTVQEIAGLGKIILFSAKNHRRRLSDGTFTDNQELWRSNGTPAGTVMVKDIHPGVRLGSYPRGIRQVGE